MARRKKPQPQVIGPIYVNIDDVGSVYRGAFSFFAALAYPTQDRSHSRARFLFDMESEMWKSYKKIGGRVERVPKIYLKRTKRQIKGGLNYGFKRVGLRRLLAGFVAWPIFTDGTPALCVNPTTCGNFETVRLKPQSVDDALRGVLESKEEHYGTRHSPSDSWTEAYKAEFRRVPFDNFKRFVWYESMPVLHLAMALRNLLLEKHDPKIPVGQTAYLLLKDTTWLPDTLVLAEWIHPQLHQRIKDFDPDRAVRLVPVTTKLS